MEQLSFSSLSLMQHELTALGKRFDNWQKPAVTLFEDLEQGAARLWLYPNGDLVIEEHKAYCAILAYRPEGLRFLQEDRTFFSFPEKKVEPSTKVSTGGKIMFARKPAESIKEALVRETAEELEGTEIPIDNPSCFCPLTLAECDDTLKESRTREGLKKFVTKHTFLWLMAPEFQRDSFCEKTLYRMSTFTWVPPSQKLVAQLRRKFGKGSLKNAA